MDCLGKRLSTRYFIIWVRETRHANFLMFFDLGPCIVWVRGAASSNSMLYMDHAFGVPSVTLMSWNEIQDFSFLVFSIISQGERGTSACRTSAYGSFGAVVCSSMFNHMGPRDTLADFIMFFDVGPYIV